MATQTINGQVWPNGTSVAVYPAEAQVAGQDTVPSGLSVTSATVGSGSVTFTGLTEGRRYVAYASGVRKFFLIQPGSSDLLRPITGAEAQSLRNLQDLSTAPTTNLRRRAWYSQPSGKLRFDAPAGVSMVHDPYYGTVNRLGSTDPATIAATTTAIKNAIADAGSWDGLGVAAYGGEVWFPSGNFNINDRILGPSSPTSMAIRGAARETSLIQLVSPAYGGVERSIIDLQMSVGGQVARIHLSHLNFQSFWRPTAADPYTVEFPLVRIGAGDLASINHVYFRYAHGDGLHIAAGTLGGVSASDSWDFYQTFTNLNMRYGIRLEHGGDFDARLNSGSHQYNFGGGIILSAAGDGRIYGRVTVENSRFEGNGGYAILMETQQGADIHSNYFLKNGVYLDEDSTENWITHNLFHNADAVDTTTGVPRSYGAQITDAGFNNVTAPNSGFAPQHPEMRKGVPYQDLLPASQLYDGEMGRGDLTVQGWTAVAATINKGTTAVEGVLSVPYIGNIGRGVPMRIAATGAGTPGAMRGVVPVTAGDEYLVEIYHSSGAAFPVTGKRVVLSDDATGTAFHTTPVISVPTGYSQDISVARAFVIRFMAAIPAGVVNMRFDIFVENGTTAREFVLRADAIKVPIANAHFGGVYAGGVAPSWATRGTGTPLEETSAHLAAVGYTKAQRLTIAAGASDTYGIEQNLVPNLNGFYLARAKVFIPSGQADPNVAERVNLRIGAHMDNSGNWMWRQRARRTGVWETLQRIYKPAAAAVPTSVRNSVSVGIEHDATFGGTFIVQEAFTVPLKEDANEKSWVSPEMVLSGAAQSFVVGMPTQDSVLRSIEFIYSAATSVDAGIQVRVGTGANATAYLAQTTQASQPLDTVLNLVPLRTDLRAGVAIRVGHPGGKVGVGNVVVRLRYA